MRARQSVFALILGASLALVLSTAARADEFWTMDGGMFCYAEDAGQAGKVSAGTVDGHYVITNFTSDSVRIYCGIIRSTSGPGISTDELMAVDATFTHPESVGSSCRVNVWSMSANAGNNGPTLEESQSSVTIPGPGTFAVYRKKATGSANNYWGSDNGGTWKYAQLDCALSGHATLAYYSVQERGTNQSRFIYSTPQVAPNATTISGIYSACNTGSSVFGGCFEGVSSYPKGFTVPLMVFPNGNAHVQVMVSPSIAVNAFTTMQCTFGGTTLVAPLNGSPSAPMDFPGRVLSFTRNNPYNQDVINCGTFRSGGVPDSSGDGKFFSYRTF